MTLRATSCRKATLVALSLLMVAGPTAAWCAQYQSIGNDPAVFYDAPTLRGLKTFVAPRGMPVEAIVAQGDWVRVRDSTGGLAWVEKKSLVDKRTVIVTAKASNAASIAAGGAAGPANVYSAPDETSQVVFRAQAGVLLDLVSAPATGWVSVRHRDGQSGYVKTGDVWGR